MEYKLVKSDHDYLTSSSSGEKRDFYFYFFGVITSLYRFYLTEIKKDIYIYKHIFNHALLLYYYYYNIGRSINVPLSE